jgi:hypothetical protein
MRYIDYLELMVPLFTLCNGSGPFSETYYNSKYTVDIVHRNFITITRPVPLIHYSRVWIHCGCNFNRPYIGFRSLSRYSSLADSKHGIS